MNTSKPIAILEEISFLPSGDRHEKPQLVKVQPDCNSNFGDDFVPIN